MFIKRIDRLRQQFSDWFPDTFFVIYLTIFILAGLFSLYWLIMYTRHTFGQDFGIYFDAYVDARSGGNPYLPYNVGSSFVSHPIVLVLVRLVYSTKIVWAMLNWTTFSIMAWLGSFVISAIIINSFSNKKTFSKIIDSSSLWLILVFIFFGPFLETITVGQINTFALFFILVALLFSEIEKPILAGLSLSCAIVLNTSPILILGYFIILRKYRVIMAAVIGALALSAISQIPFSSPILGQFINILPNLSSEIHTTTNNQSLINAAVRIFGSFNFDDLGQILSFANRVILGFLLIILYLVAWRRGPFSRERRIWLFAGFLILMVTFSPLVWYHHYVFLLLPLVLLLTNTSIFLRIIGISVLTLLQSVRYFEFSIVRFPWPAIFAMLIILITFLLGLFVSKSSRSFQVFASTSSDEQAVEVS